MNTTRRRFLKQTAVTCLGSAMVASQPLSGKAKELQNKPMIIDTHQHLWDLSKLKLPWLAEAPEVLRHNFRTAEYLEATRGLNVKAVYMEVDVDPQQQVAEAEHVIAL